MAETRSLAKPKNHAGIHLLQDAPQGTDADVCRLVINSAENETYIYRQVQASSKYDRATLLSACVREHYMLQLQVASEFQNVHVRGGLQTDTRALA